MITKINPVTPLNYSYNKSISFRGYNTTSEDIDIFSKSVDSPIKSMSGDIDITESKIKGKISNMSGDVCVSSSSVNGNIENMSGKVKISENSAINGHINNTSGSIILSKSSVSGDVFNAKGKVLVRDSVVGGTLTAKPEKLFLEGNNKINELVLTGVKKAAAQDVEQIKADLAKQGIFIGNIGHVNNACGSVIINTFCGNELKSTKIVSSDKPLEFILPKGSTINTIKFDADKQGTLILDKGAKFLGKIINGVIKRI